MILYLMYINLKNFVINKISKKVMSKTSSKSKYEQLMVWLPTLGQSKKSKVEKQSTKFSKGDYYKQQGVK